MTATTEEEQAELLKLYERICYDKKAAGNVSNDICGVWWDGIMCWPATTAGLATLPCPTYIVGFRTDANASKLCYAEAMWENWTDFRQCYYDNPTVLVDVNLNGTDFDFWIPYIPLVKTLSHVGYGVSEVTLIMAFFILASFKRLRCPRNMLHLHLFVSFIMRAFMGFIKSSVFEEGVGPISDFAVKNGKRYFHEEEQGNWECKALTILWEYFIAANYSWVLVEGLYIHNVLMWALSADSSSIRTYILLGWGLPLKFVPSWALARAFWDDDLCWTVNNVQEIRYIISGPTLLSLVINFGLFINIFRLLMSKVRMTIQEEAQRYRRLAKSTMILVALFGIPYLLFFGMYFGNEKVQLAWLICDQTFASFQGFFVALLYCFLNHEVQDELKRKWKKTFYNGRVMDNTFPTSSFASWSSSHSMTYGRCSLTRFYHNLRRCFTCRHRPESRASKRTETVDCIVCETCPGYYENGKRGSLSEKRCQHENNDPGVEMKLMAHKSNTN